MTDKQDQAGIIGIRLGRQSKKRGISRKRVANTDKDTGDGRCRYSESVAFTADWRLSAGDTTPYSSVSEGEKLPRMSLTTDQQ